mgnify:FL=1
MEKSPKKTSPRILVTGGDGMLGSYFKNDLRFLRFGKTDLDVTNFSQVEKILRAEKPNIILHLAALTDMKKCEEDPNLARNINEIGTYNIARVAKEIEAKVVYVSTNAVFDGQKTVHTLS